MTTSLDELVAADRVLAAHLSVAILRHKQACRMNGSTPPPGLTAMLEIVSARLAAGPVGTVFAGQDAAGDSRGEESSPDRLLTKAEAAQQLSCCERTITRLVAAGKLEEIRITARSPRYQRSAIRSLLAQGSPKKWR